MKILDTNIDAVKQIKPDIFKDNRGYFFESFNENRYKEAGIDYNFVQDNVSKSSRGTVRGLHYQVGEFAQCKLCFVLYGRVLDVALDIRFGSPTFGKYVCIELSADEHNQIWIPIGFAHGFSVLSDEAVFAYKCTALYSKKDERSIIFNDPDLAIDWKIEKPNVSEKDLTGKEFKKIGKDFFYNK